MRRVLTIILTLGVFACNHPSNQTQVLEKRIDSLERILAKHTNQALENS